MNFMFLADRPDAISLVAAWYIGEWGYRDGETGPISVEENLRVYLERDRLPLILLAVDGEGTDGEEILGAAQLKFREMDIYPEKEHWLGGVYVASEHRGRGVASALVGEAIRIARGLGVERLHLQTEHPQGGIYAHLGFEPLERVTYHGIDVLVMTKEINPKG